MSHWNQPPRDETAPDDETTPESQPLTFADLDKKPCPNCTVGVLHVVTFDPTASHEIGQAVEPNKTSGGASQLRCFHCEYSESVPLNPGPDYGKAA